MHVNVHLSISVHLFPEEWLLAALWLGMMTSMSVWLRQAYSPREDAHSVARRLAELELSVDRNQVCQPHESASLYLVILMHASASCVCIALEKPGPCKCMGSTSLLNVVLQGGAVCTACQGWVRGGSKEDAKHVTRQREMLTQQEREIAQLRAQLDKMQVRQNVSSRSPHLPSPACLHVSAPGFVHVCGRLHGCAVCGACVCAAAFCLCTCAFECMSKCVRL